MSKIRNAGGERWVIDHKFVQHQEAARKIDTAWKYSWHWPSYGWQAVALEECRDRITENLRDLENLQNLEKRLAQDVDYLGLSDEEAAP